ncbi:MAG: export ABC transporter ATP-binding protein, partial [Spirochaetota bacterium]
LMEEAQELSNRVGIIDHGRLIAVGTQDELTARVEEYDRIEVELETMLGRDEYSATLAELEGVHEVRTESGSEPDSAGPGRIVLLARDGRRLLPSVVEISNRQRMKVTGIRVTEPNLESVFLTLTGRALRD